MVTYKISGNEMLSEEELNALENAKKSPILYDRDAPELSSEMETAFIAARRAKPYNSEPVTLYLNSETIAKARHIGPDYIAVLGRLLDQAVADYRVS